MARQFGTYSPVVPLGVTWEEELILTDEDDAPVDLTGYSLVVQLREDVPEIDIDTGEPTTDPVFEITSAAFYDDPPAWPVFAVAAIVAVDGNIKWLLPIEDLWTASPDNAKRKLVWAVVLAKKADGYAIPCVEGKPTFLSAKTILPRTP